MAGTEPTTESPPPGERKPYRAPRLTVHGDLRAQTRGGSSLKKETHPNKAGTRP